MPLLLRTVSEPVTGTVAGAAETPGFVPKPAVSAALIGRPELLELAHSGSRRARPAYGIEASFLPPPLFLWVG
jgi:hypothetical protein